MSLYSNYLYIYNSLKFCFLISRASARTDHRIHNAIGILLYPEICGRCRCYCITLHLSSSSYYWRRQLFSMKRLCAIWLSFGHTINTLVTAPLQLLVCTIFACWSYSVALHYAWLAAQLWSAPTHSYALLRPRQVGKALHPLAESNFVTLRPAKRFVLSQFFTFLVLHSISLHAAWRGMDGTQDAAAPCLCSAEMALMGSDSTGSLATTSALWITVSLELADYTHIISISPTMQSKARASSVGRITRRPKAPLAHIWLRRSITCWASGPAPWAGTAKASCPPNQYIQATIIMRELTFWVFPQTRWGLCTAGGNSLFSFTIRSFIQAAVDMANNSCEQ